MRDPEKLIRRPERAALTPDLMNNLNADDDSALVSALAALETCTVKSYVVYFV